jgi:uncharacterized protein YceH (UPF0502 family)
MENREIELLVQELQSRIGQITSQYETELAAIKVQAHVRIENLEKELAELKEKADGDK